ncbi:MAG: HIRAN domain-containing protein [Bacteroidota bacterium]
MSGIVKISPGLVAFLQGKDGTLMPFAKELVVLECQIAGTSHLDLEAVEPSLNIGDKFLLLREPENEFDRFAVAIYTAEKVKLGFLPMNRNESTARLLDAGKLLFAVLETKEWRDEWLKLSIKVNYIDR